MGGVTGVRWMAIVLPSMVTSVQAVAITLSKPAAHSALEGGTPLAGSNPGSGISESALRWLPNGAYSKLGPV